MPFNGGCGGAQRSWLKAELDAATAAGERVVVGDVSTRWTGGCVDGLPKTHTISRYTHMSAKEVSVCWIARTARFGCSECMQALRVCDTPYMLSQVCSHLPLLAAAASPRTLMYDADHVLAVLHGRSDAGAEAAEAAAATPRRAPSCVVAVFAGHMHRGGCAMCSFFFTFGPPPSPHRSHAHLLHQYITLTYYITRYAADALGVHHVTLPSPLNFDECFGHCDVFADRLEVIGALGCPRELRFPPCPPATAALAPPSRL